MSDEQDNSGALFKNNDRKNDRQPHYRGVATVAGIEYWVSSWIRKSKAGKTYMSMAFEPKEQQDQTDPETPDDVNLDEDIPF